jgi:hypothetical protein
MEGLFLALIDACKRENMTDIRECFQRYMIEKNGEFDYNATDSATHFNHCVDNAFSRGVNIFRRECNGVHWIPYMVKVAFGTTDNWLPLIKRIMSMGGVLYGNWRDFSTMTLFDCCKKLETANDAYNWVLNNCYDAEKRELIAKYAFLCWRDEEKSKQVH